MAPSETSTNVIFCLGRAWHLGLGEKLVLAKPKNKFHIFCSPYFQKSPCTVTFTIHYKSIRVKLKKALESKAIEHLRVHSMQLENGALPQTVIIRSLPQGLFAHFDYIHLETFDNFRLPARVFFFTLHSHFNPIVHSQHTSPHHGLKVKRFAKAAFGFISQTGKKNTRAGRWKQIPSQDR